MAVAYRGTSGYATRAGNSTSPISVPQVSGTAAGDLLILTVATFQLGAGTITTPSGWTLIDTSPGWGGSGGYASAVFWKVAVSSEPAVSVTTSSSSYLDANIAAFTGVDTTTPIDAASTWGPNATGTTVTVPAVTTVTANAWWVCVAADAGYLIGAAPAGFTLRHEAFPYATQLMLATKALTAAGAQAATTCARSSGNGGTAISVALRESGAAVPSTFVPQIVIS